MNRRLATYVAAFAAFVLSGVTLGATAAWGETGTIRLASGPGWAVFTRDPGNAHQNNAHSRLGHAQLVCMSPSAPPGCPPTATIYNSPFFGWTADLSPIPDARWVWAPGVDGNSAPADLADYFFSQTIVVPGHPTSGSLLVAVDDYAAIRVNGILVGTLGSVTDPSLAGKHTFLTSFDLTSALKPGVNVLTVEAQNGPAFFSGLCTVCTYSLNPAGVVFGGSIEFQRDH